MNRRITLSALTAAIVLPGALVSVGRLEESHHARAEVKGMRGVLQEIGRLDSPSLSAYRRMSDFDCLLYRRGDDPFALEVCVDRRGRLIEAIDRRSGDPRAWSLLEDPGASAIRLDRALVDRLLPPPPS